MTNEVVIKRSLPLLLLPNLQPLLMNVNKCCLPFVVQSLKCNSVLIRLLCSGIACHLFLFVDEKDVILERYNIVCILRHLLCHICLLYSKVLGVCCIMGFTILNSGYEAGLFACFMKFLL